jgi:hypothetical protein
MKPPCYDRPPVRATYTANDGYDAEGRLKTKEIPWFAPDRCATHDGRGIGPAGESYPVAHGWACGGCKWAPPGITLAVNCDTTEVPNNER